MALPAIRAQRGAKNRRRRERPLELAVVLVVSLKASLQY